MALDPNTIPTLRGLGLPSPAPQPLPIPQAPGGLGAMGGGRPSPDDALEREQTRLVSSSPLDYLKELVSGEGLDKLRDTKDKANKEQVDNLLKQGEYSGLDAAMAGLRGMQLSRVPMGVSPLAFGFQGTGDATDKFTTLRDKYKQMALDIQAKEAQQAYTDQWNEVKQARQLGAQENLNSARMLNLQKVADAKAQVELAKAALKAAGGGVITQQTAAKIEQMTNDQLKAEWEMGSLSNDPIAKEARRLEIYAEVAQRITGTTGAKPANAVATPANAVAAPSATSEEPVGAFQGDPNMVMKQLARIHDPAAKIAAGEAFANQLGRQESGVQQASVQPATPVATTQPTSAGLTKDQVALKTAKDRSLVPGTDEYTRAQAAQESAGKYNTETTITLGAANTAADTAIHHIDTILDPRNKTGFEGSYGGWNAYLTALKSGNTAKVQSAIDSLKSNMKMAGLSVIRAGGSIGQMTEREWPIVESMLDTLTPRLSEKDARQKLKELRAAFEVYKAKAVKEATTRGTIGSAPGTAKPTGSFYEAYGLDQ